MIRNLGFSELFSKAASSLIIRLAGLIINYVFLYFVTSSYGSKGWGVFAISFSVLQLATLIAIRGLDEAIVRLRAERVSNFKVLFNWILRSTIITSLLLTILIYGFAGQINVILGDNNLNIQNEIQIISFGILPLSIIMLIGGLFRGQKEIMSFSFYDRLGKFLMGLIFTYLIVSIYSSESSVVIGFTIGLYVLMILSILQIWIQKKEINGQQRKSTIKELNSLGNNMFWTTLVNHGGIWITTLILGIYLTKESVGIFDTLLRVSLVSNVILISFNSILGPQLAENINKPEILRSKIQQTSKFLSLISFPIILSIAFFGDEIMELFEIQTEYYIVLVILLVGQLINNLCGSNGTFLQMTGNHILGRKIVLSTFIINNLCLLAVVPSFGLVGAAIVWSSSIILRNIITVYMILKKTGILTIYIPTSNRL